MHPKQIEEIERVKAQSRRLATGELLPGVVAFMRREVPELGEHLFLTAHIPEQGEEFYGFVTSNGLHVTVEVSRQDGAIEITELKSDGSLLHLTPGNLSKDRTLNAIRYVISELNETSRIDQNP
jgi:hypothetical protein